MLVVDLAEAGREDGLDGPVAQRADVERAAAGGLEALGAISWPQPLEAEAAAVGRRHVRRVRRLSAFPVAAQVYGDVALLVEDLHGPRREPNVDIAAGQCMGDTVEGALYLDVIVDVDAGPGPLGELVPLGRERLDRRPVQILEPAASAAFGLLEEAP